jgi:hypothetical protein
MSTSVGLNFRLTAAVDKFEASMRDVEKRLGGIESATQQTAKGMRILAAIEVGRTIIGGLSAVGDMMKSVASSATAMFNASRETTDALGKLATSTGMTHEPLQVLTRVADHSGVSATQFGDALQKLSRGLGEAANGTGTAKRALEQLGIPIDSLIGMAPEQQFMKIAAAIGEIQDPTTRSAIAADLFGRAGTKLIPMFTDLEENVKGTAKEMLELGQVLSGTQITNVEAMNDRFSDVLRTVSGLRDQIVANIAPALKAMADDALALVKAFEYNGSTGGQALANYLTEAFLNGAKVLADWAEWILNGLKDFLSGFSKVIGDLLMAMSGLADWLPGVDESTVDGLAAAGESAKSFGEALDGFTFNFSGYVKEAIDSFATSANEAAQNTNKFIDSIGPAGASFDSFAAELEAGGTKATQPITELGTAAKEAAKAATATWTPLKGIETHGSLAVGAMGRLGLALATNAGANKLTADEVARLGKSASAVAEDLKKPPKSMDIKLEDWAKQYGDLQGQALEMLQQAQKERFNQGTIDTYMKNWQQTADHLMEMYKKSGKYSQDFLDKQMEFERNRVKDGLEKFSKTKLGLLRMENDISKNVLDEYQKNGMEGGLFGDTSLDDGVDPDTGLPLRELEDPAWADDLNGELSDQTALLDQINGKLDFTTAVIG